MTHPAQSLADVMLQSGPGQVAKPSLLRETAADLVDLRVRIRHAQRRARPQDAATALADVATDLSMWIDDVTELGVEHDADDSLYELAVPPGEPSTPSDSRSCGRPVVLSVAEMEDVLVRVRRRALSTPRSTPSEELLVEVARGLQRHIAQLAQYAEPSAQDRIASKTAPVVH